MRFRISIFILAIGIFIPSRSLAGFDWVIGYQVGKFTKAHRNMQAQAQAFNYLSGSGLKTPMHMNGYFRGIVLGVQGNNENFMFGFRWTRKNSFSSIGENSTHTQQFKIRVTSLQMEMALGGEFVKFGASVDLMFLRVFNKFIEKSSGNGNEWSDYYSGSDLFTKGELAAGGTFFINFQMGRFFELRPYAQIPYTSADILDDNTRRSYHHPLFNYGIHLCLTL